LAWKVITAIATDSRGNAMSAAVSEVIEDIKPTAGGARTKPVHEMAPITAMVAPGRDPASCAACPMAMGTTRAIPIPIAMNPIVAAAGVLANRPAAIATAPRTAKTGNSAAGFLRASKRLPPKRIIAMPTENPRRPKPTMVDRAPTVSRYTADQPFTIPSHSELANARSPSVNSQRV
jgi:hypothetical protein